MKPLTAVAFLACLYSSVLAQDEVLPAPLDGEVITVSDVTFRQQTAELTRIALIDEEGEVVSSTESTGTFSGPVDVEGKQITVSVDALTVRLFADNIKRENCTDKFKPVVVDGGRSWVVSEPGKYWVRIRVANPDPWIDEEFHTVIEIRGPPDDEQDDPEDDDTPPLPDIDVDDEYGVGSVAAQYAPNHPGTRQYVGQRYKRAAEFLYGQPYPKAIEDRTNPDNSVIYWLKTELDNMQCPDPQVCGEWQEFRRQINTAFGESQRSRQFTKEDWYKALKEVAKALGVN